LTNNSIANVTAYNAAVSTGGMVLISSQTANNSASISFTTGINSTYKEYQFYFINCRPATDNVSFMFNMSTNSGSTYAVTKTTTKFRANHDEADTEATLSYDGDVDLAQSTDFCNLGRLIGNGSDESCAGTLQLFNPSSTTYVKHFIYVGNEYFSGNNSINNYIAGYGNTTSAVNAIRFQMSSGNIADGIFKLYGVKKS
jgi:hypothetical protein